MREPVTASWPFPPLSAAISLWQSCRCNAPVHQPQFHRLAGRADRESSQIGLVQVEVANLHAGNAAKVKMAQIKVPRTHWLSADGLPANGGALGCAQAARDYLKVLQTDLSMFLGCFFWRILHDADCVLAWAITVATRLLKDRSVQYLTPKWCVLFGIAAAQGLPHTSNLSWASVFLKQI